MKPLGLAVLIVLAPLLLPFAQAQPTTKKRPVPSKEAVDSAVTLIGELFRSDLAKAGEDRDQRLKTAQTFLFEAKETHDDPGGKYVLLRESAAMAAGAGEAALALQALEEMALSFDIAAPAMLTLKAQALQKASKVTSTAVAYQGMLDAALALQDEALAWDDFDNALPLGQTAEAAAKKLKSVPLVSAVRKRNEGVIALHAEFAKIKPFLETLANNPQDAKANLAVGKYHAFIRGNWEKGLPLLARGGDGSLSKLAALDLSDPKSAKQVADIANGWLAEGNRVKGQPNTQALLRAYRWFQRGLDHPDVGNSQREVSLAAMKHINDTLPADLRVGEIAVEIRRCIGHEGPVFGVAMSGEGGKMASCGADATVRLWEAKNAKELRRFSGHNGPVWCVRFSPDGRHVLSGGFDKTIRLWDPVSGRESNRLIGHEDYVRAVAYSGNGKLVLSGSDDRTVKAWDIGGGGAEPKTLRGHDHFVFGTAVSRDGKRGLSASLDHTVRLWDLQSGSTLQILNGHTDTVLSVVFTPDEGRALSASTDKTLRLWDLATGRTIHIFKGHTGYVHSVAISPDGRRALSAGQDGKVILWDVDNGKLVRLLEGHIGPVWAVAFSGDGRFAASAGNDGTLRLWGAGK